MEEKEIILGLDVSTATIGVCVLLNDNTEDGKILELTHVAPKVKSKITGIESLFLKKRIFEEEFLKKWEKVGITKVVIEEPLLSSNNSITCSTLLRFNGMISDSIYEILGVVPQYISSYEARKYAFPELMSIRKYDKKGNKYPNEKIIKSIENGKLVLFGSYAWDADKKSIIQTKVAEKYPQIEWLYNSNGELKKENFDACDAYVATLGFINKEKHGVLEPKVEDIVKEGDKIKFNIKIWDKKIEKTVFLEEK